MNKIKRLDEFRLEQLDECDWQSGILRWPRAASRCCSDVLVTWDSVLHLSFCL